MPQTNNRINTGFDAGVDVGDDSASMWPARFSTAVEDAVEGERLTDEVLRSAT
jgi:hypothetical protein